MRSAALALFLLFVAVSSCPAAESRRAETWNESAMAPAKVDAPGMALALGGDDVVVYSGPTFPDPHLEIASDGTIFVANMVGFGGDRIEVFRSTDGGNSFALWSVFTDPEPQTIFGADMVLAEGDVDRLFVAYRQDKADRVVKVAYADPFVESPTWTPVVALGVTGTDIGEDSQIDLDTDAVDFSDYYLYVAARGTDGNGGDIWFARSGDQGSTWEAGYRAVSYSASSDAFYFNPHIAYGSGGYIHLAYNFTGSSFAESLYHRRAENYATAGAAAWSGQTILGLNGSGFDTRAIGIAADAGGNTVFVQKADPGGSIIRWSSDQGASWPISSQASLTTDPFMDGPIDVDPSDGSAWFVGSNELDGHPQLEIQSQSLNVSDPSDVGPVQTWARQDWDVYNHLYDIARDPTHGNRRAVVWQRYEGTSYRLHFDAEWRRDPGYPVTDVGFPVTIPSADAYTPPAIANVDADPYGEIVFGTLSGEIYVVSHLGTIPGGWPRNLGTSLPIDGPVAVGNLNDHGMTAIVAGTNDGRVFALDRTGEPLPGFPVDLGTGVPTYVSIGALGPPYHRYIVACSGPRLVVLSYRGEDLSPAWGTAVESFSRPAAIGDLEGDGNTEIVVRQTSWVSVFRLDTPGPVHSRNFPSESFSDMPSLGDIDRDGDKEIVLPTASGKIIVLNSDLSDYGPGFPYDTGDPYPVTAVSLADLLGNSELELVYGQHNGKVGIVWYDGVTGVNYPQNTLGPIYTPPIVSQIHPTSPDVVVSAQFWVHAWENLAAIPDGWPRNLVAPSEMTPAAGDIDLDGSNEVAVLAADRLHVYDVNTPPDSAERSRWSMYGNNAQRTGCQECAEDFATGVEDATRPSAFSFAPVFPNPANSLAQFRYALPEEASVSLRIYNARGRLVRTVFEGEEAAGHRTQVWDGRSDGGRLVARGIYLARLVVDGGGEGKEWTRKVSWTR